MNNAINPVIFVIIDIEYKIDSGNKTEYHPKNSPSASNPNPTDTEIAPLFLFSKYDSIVSMAPYASKINDTDLKMCSSCTDDTRNSGRMPTDLKYFDVGKNAFMLCENAIKKYPIV